MSENKQVASSDTLTRVVEILAVAFWFLFLFATKGLFRKKTWTKDFINGWSVYIATVILLAYAPKWNIPSILYRLPPSSFFQGFAEWVYFHLSSLGQVLFFVLLPLFLYLLFIGVVEFLKVRKFQNAIDHLGLKTSTGLQPKVKDRIEINENQSKIIVQAIGIDVADFKSRKGSLESSLNAIVQDVRVSPKSKQLFEIFILNKELPTLVRFEDLTNLLTKPYTFLVGQSNDEMIIADLCSIHHMLLAGATGGGKSVFFKQALIGLLKSSKYIQLYLIDLKRGVDLRPFQALSNVQMVKDIVPTLELLRSVVAEMNRRFEFLETSGHNEIDPERDKLDRLVVGIDEASVLFTVEKGTKGTQQMALEARELTDKLAKLGRAAGIHVILATQKVVKETIDTRVQTNIHARMCFRMNTMASSMTVLGNKKAAELPHTKGRGIWSVGSHDIEVQVPFLDHEEANEEIEVLTQKFNGEDKPMFRPMLNFSGVKTKQSKVFKSKNVQDDTEDSDEGAA